MRQRCSELEATLEPIAIPESPFDTAFQVRLDAAIASFEQQSKTDLATSIARGRALGDVVTATFDHLERRASLEIAGAESAMQQVLDRVRAGQLSRKQLAVLARAITTRLGEVELAIAKARAACEDDTREVEQWMRAVGIAVKTEDEGLAEASRERVDEWRRHETAANTALQESVELRDRLLQLGRVVLEVAGT